MPHAVLPRPPEPRVGGVFTPGEIRRLRAALRLTPEQEPHWPPVEGALQEIGAQQLAAVKAGQDANTALGSGTTMKVYWAARPLLNLLREDQKSIIRARAQSMGFGSVASYL